MFGRNDDMPVMGRVTRFRQGMSIFERCRWCKGKLAKDARGWVVCGKCDAADPDASSPFAGWAGNADA